MANKSKVIQMFIVLRCFKNYGFTKTYVNHLSFCIL